MDQVHLVHLVPDSQQKNVLFQRPVPDTAQNILDIGTDNGIWVKDIAEKYPHGASVVCCTSGGALLTYFSSFCSRCRSLPITEYLCATELQVYC